MEISSGLEFLKLGESIILCNCIQGENAIILRLDNQVYLQRTQTCVAKINTSCYEFIHLRARASD